MIGELGCTHAHVSSSASPAGKAVLDLLQGVGACLEHLPWPSMSVPAVAVLRCYRLHNRVRVLLLRLLRLLMLLLEEGPKRGNRQLKKGGSMFINHSLVNVIGNKPVRAREKGGTRALPLLRRRPVCLHGQVMIPCSWVRHQTSRVRVEYSTVGMCLVNGAGEAVAV